MSTGLAGRYAVVTGIANKRSIAWGIARVLDREGATLALTYQTERFRANIEELASQLARPPLLLPLDVGEDQSLTALALALQEAWGRVDMVVHSIAFANREDLEGRFLDTSREGFRLALDISAYSLTALVRTLYPLLRAAGGGSVVTMTYEGATRVMPHYNVMGVAKAALEASVRYLAYDLGPDRIRVNAISAGPVRTLAASAVKGFSHALRQVEAQAPLKENITPEDLGEAALYLLGTGSTHVTGQILYVDSGSHIMGFAPPTDA